MMGRLATLTPGFTSLFTAELVRCALLVGNLAALTPGFTSLFTAELVRCALLVSNLAALTPGFAASHFLVIILVWHSVTPSLASCSCTWSIYPFIPYLMVRTHIIRATAKKSFSYWNWQKLDALWVSP